MVDRTKQHFTPLRRYGIGTIRGKQQLLRDCSAKFFEWLPVWLKHREKSRLTVGRLKRDRSTTFVVTRISPDCRTTFSRHFHNSWKFGENRLSSVWVNRGNVSVGSKWVGPLWMWKYISNVWLSMIVSGGRSILMRFYFPVDLSGNVSMVE